MSSANDGLGLGSMWRGHHLTSGQRKWRQQSYDVPSSDRYCGSPPLWKEQMLLYRRTNKEREREKTRQAVLYLIPNRENSKNFLLSGSPVPLIILVQVIRLKGLRSVTPLSDGTPLMPQEQSSVIRF